MIQLRLIRVTEYNGATLGVLCVDDSPDFVTLEDLWLQNERNISCIPQGRYTLKLHRSPKYGICYKVMDVPERDAILIHAGNTSKDTRGCILLGMQYGRIGSEPAVLQSKIAVNKFMDLLAGQESAELVIISAYGGGRVH